MIYCFNEECPSNNDDLCTREHIVIGESGMCLSKKVINDAEPTTDGSSREQE